MLLNEDEQLTIAERELFDRFDELTALDQRRSLAVGRQVLVHSSHLITSTMHPTRMLEASNYRRAGIALYWTDDEHATHVLRRKKESSGVAYARHMMQKRSYPHKDRARSRVLSQFSITNWPEPLSILTMPGLRWQFERQLLNIRPDLQTTIQCVENDPAIFRASKFFMPGEMRTEASEGYGLSFKCSELIDGYHCIDVEQFIYEAELDDYNAAWLDFTGPLTEARLRCLRRFWQRTNIRLLAVTWLDARFCGRCGEWVRNYKAKGRTSTDLLLDFITKKAPGFPGRAATEVDRHRYSEGFSPMAQLIIKRFVEPAAEKANGLNG